MTHDVKLAVRESYRDLPNRLREYLLKKFSTVGKAIEYFQVSSSTMYSYIPSQAKPGKGEFVYPNVQFLMKLADLGCNLHWLITGDGKMDVDLVDIADSKHAEDKLKFLNVVYSYSFSSPEHLDRVLRFVVSLTDIREFLSGDIGLRPKPLPSPEDNAPFSEDDARKVTAAFNEQQSQKGKGRPQRGT